MSSIIQRSTGIFTRLCAGAASLCMFLLFSIVFTNAIRRYTIGKSFTWGDELSIFIAIYGVMFASAVAYIQDRHIRFTMLVGFLSRKWLHMLYCFVDLMMVAIGGLLAYSGWMFTLKRGGMEVSGLITLAKTLRSLTGWENMIVFGHYFPYQAAICFGGILLAIAACLKLCLRVTEIGKRSWGKHEDL